MTFYELSNSPRARLAVVLTDDPIVSLLNQNPPAAGLRTWQIEDGDKFDVAQSALACHFTHIKGENAELSSKAR
jgi:hypothetical protein